MARQTVIHYGYPDSPSVLCGSGATSTLQWTMNPETVTCQRCLRSFASRAWRRVRAQQRWDETWTPPQGTENVVETTEPDDEDDGMTDDDRNNWMGRLGIR